MTAVDLGLRLLELVLRVRGLVQTHVGCDQVWLPISCSARPAGRATGKARTWRPIRKNVAVTSFSSRMSSTRAVYFERRPVVERQRDLGLGRRHPVVDRGGEQSGRPILTDGMPGRDERQIDPVLLDADRGAGADHRAAGHQARRGAGNRGDPWPNRNWPGHAPPLEPN